MRILLINYEMNEESPVLAASVALVNELAPRVESLTVLTEKIGKYKLISNLYVEEIPRRPFGIPKSLGGGCLAIFQLYKLLQKHPCDVCYIHMAHKWAYRFWPVFKFYKIPVLMWYAHGSVKWHLYLATWCANKIVTPTDESFRINTSKKTIIGHGIDAQLFNPPAARTPLPEVVSVGRLSPRKRPMLAVDVLAALRAQDPTTPWRLKLVGPCLGAADEAHLKEVRQHIAALGLEAAVDITGPLTQAQTVDLYKTARLHLNVSQTGSMDKTVLESLACGCPVVTTNEAFQAMPEIFCPSSAAADLAKALLSAQDRLSPEAARALVTGQHDLAHWADEVMGLFARLSR